MISNEPLISVVIPAYNAEKRLDTCLASICGQNWNNLEIIVVDDGSRDATLEKARGWARRDGRIRVIHQENGGVASARNRALEECSGQWVRFVDADDILPAGSLESLYHRMEEDGSDLVIAGYEHQVGDFCRAWNMARSDETLSCDEYLDFLNKYANTFFCGVLWNKLFRRDLIETRHVRFVSGLSYGEDFCFVCDYLWDVEKISYSTDIVYRYVRHPHSMTFSQTMDSVKHPIRNLRVKWRLYQTMKRLYEKKGRYEMYRRTLWRYMIRVTFNR